MHQSHGDQKMIRTKSSRSRWHRLAQLEEIVEEAYGNEPTGPISPPEWLEYYQGCAKTRIFDREPDFKATVTEYARMLEAYPASRHIPTDDFEPEKPERERMRLWQIRHNIYELNPIEKKLTAMARRAFGGLDGVSEAEFAQKKAWFDENIWDLPMHYMVAEDGTTEPRINTIETVLYQGTPSRYALNAMITMREWEKGNYDKTTTYGEWRRKRQLQGN